MLSIAYMVPQHLPSLGTPTPSPHLSKRVLRCRRLRGSVFSRLFCFLSFCLSLPYWGIPHTTPECHLSISYQVFLAFFFLLPVPQTWLWLVGCFVSDVQTIVASSIWWWEWCLLHWFCVQAYNWLFVTQFCTAHPAHDMIVEHFDFLDHLFGPCHCFGGVGNDW